MAITTSLRERFARSFKKKLVGLFAITLLAIGGILMGFLWHQRQLQTHSFIESEEQRLRLDVDAIRESAERIAHSIPPALFTDSRGPYEYVDDFTRELELYGMDVGWIVTFHQGAARPWIDGRRRIVLADANIDLLAGIAADLTTRPWPQLNEGSGRSYHFLREGAEPGVSFLEAFPLYVGPSRAGFLVVGRHFSGSSAMAEELRRQAQSGAALVNNVGILYEGKEIFRVHPQSPAFFDEVIESHFLANSPHAFPIKLRAYAQTKDLWATFALCVLVGFVGLVVGLAAIGAWTRRTVKEALTPLQALVDGTALLATGDFSARVEEPNEEELFALASKFNLLAASLQQDMEKLSEAARREEETRRRAAEAEIIQLRAQLQPHFLFNSLSMVAQTILDNPERAHEMTLSLAELFQAILRASSKISHTLEEELALVSSYLHIQAMRFEHRLTYAIPLSPLEFSLQVPCLALQNLVENALKHGIIPVRAGGHIAIRLEAFERRLCIVVENNGIPIPNNLQEGTGLQNTRRRWRLLHGESAALVLDVTEDGKSRSILSVERAAEVVS